MYNYLKSFTYTTAHMLRYESSLSTVIVDRLINVTKYI